MSEAKNQTGLPLPEALAGNFQEAARWFQQLWTANADPAAAARNAGGPLPSMMLPTMDVQELGKRISDLRSVQNWLELNLGMLRTTIQALEMQRGTLLAWQGLGASAGAPPAGAAEHPATAWWNALQQQFAQMAAGAAASEAEPPKTATAPPPAGKPGAGKPKA